MALTTIPASLSATALTLTTAAQPNVTSLGTLTTLTVDDITLNGSTISDTGDLTFDVGGDIILDAAGGNVGIGTTSPSYGLTVSDSTAGTSASRRITIQSSTHGANAGLRFDAESADGTLRSAGYYFQPGNTDATTYLGLAADDSSTHLAITRAGKVGIGTSSPSRTFHSKGASGISTAGKFEAGGSQVYIQLSSTGQADGDSGYIGYDSSKNLTLFTDNSERMRITSAGDVGIGITPSSALSIYRASGVNAYIEVAGNNNTPGGTSMLFGQDSGNYGYCWNRANQAVLFGTNGTERMRIDANGNFAINRTAGALGTAANRTAFTINGTNETSFNIATGGTQRAYLFSNGSYAQLSTVGSIPLNLGVNDSSKMTIDTSGNVSVSPGTFTASNVINIATESTTQTTTARQWATIKNTGTGAGDYSEMAIRNNADDYIIFGSIGSNYSNANWSNSSYIYANRELRIKSNNAIRFFSGGMNLNTHDNMVLESSGHLTLKGQIVGGFGAIGTGGTTDWNHATNARSGMGYTLLLGNATNGPGVSSIYYHAVNFEYSSKNGNGNMTQLAIPYYGSTTIYMRQRYSGTWSSWGAV